MPRVCRACAHPEREQLDAALAAGEPNRTIASRFELSPAGVQRHKAQCVPATLARVQVERAESLGAMWERIRRELDDLVSKAKADKDRRSLLRALDQLSDLVALGLKASELQRRDSNATPIDQHPQWSQLVAALLSALDRHPMALADVRQALAVACGERAA